jgi:cytochrome c-type protein NapB
MKRLVWIGVMFGCLVLSAQSMAGSLQSLRGAQDIPAESLAPEKLKLVKDKEKIARTFEEQPPVVPHKVESYTVNLKENKCLDCHSKETAKEKDATEVSESHYQTRDGKKLDSLSARRYFCTQCHVPQAIAPPLVENDFKTIERLSQSN